MRARAKNQCGILRTLVWGAGGGIETDEDEPKLERAPSQRSENMLSGDCSPASLELPGAEGQRLLTDAAITDEICLRRDGDFLLPSSLGLV